jgi:hypothetical protein
MGKQVRIGFDPRGVSIPVTAILPTKQLRPMHKASQKYQQILASVREVGIIEPLIVFPQPGSPGIFLLLDGHARLDVLKELGQAHARCLISTDDEAYTVSFRQRCVVQLLWEPVKTSSRHRKPADSITAFTLVKKERPDASGGNLKTTLKTIGLSFAFG